MERLTGGTAFQRMRLDDPAPPTSCSWAVALCAGLQYAHEREVLHRDVKPENMMFSHDGTLRVTDFGIAKLMSADEPDAERRGDGDARVHRPRAGAGPSADAGTDLYAVGTVLYEMLAGKLPYATADSALAALFQHVHEDHRPLLDAAPEVPPPVAAVVERSLARDPAERFGSAAEMSGALLEAGETSWGPVWEEELNSVLRSPITGGAPDAGLGRRPRFVPARPGRRRRRRRRCSRRGRPLPTQPRRSRRPRPAILAACGFALAALIAAGSSCSAAATSRPRPPSLRRRAPGPPRS